MSKIIDNLAYAKSKFDYTESAELSLNALQLRKESKDYSGQFASYIHLTEHFYRS